MDEKRTVSIPLNSFLSCALTMSAVTLSVSGVILKLCLATSTLALDPMAVTLHEMGFEATDSLVARTQLK